ncbi:MAG: hypothetical protein CMI53_05425 [Parcubacteria group bacterium]|nr:hypothetical protein [Parcubacteria group bacterium]|tara:strand:+ start:3751 stop:4131 length:381 start_codon:yes stop_codon:yes gene_type:complete
MASMESCWELADVRLSTVRCGEQMVFVNLRFGQENHNDTSNDSCLFSAVIKAIARATDIELSLIQFNVRQVNDHEVEVHATIRSNGQLTIVTGIDNDIISAFAKVVVAAVNRSLEKNKTPGFIPGC